MKNSQVCSASLLFPCKLTKKLLSEIERLRTAGWCSCLTCANMVWSYRSLSQMHEDHSTQPSKLKAPSNFNEHWAEDIRRTLLNNAKQTVQALNSTSTRYRGDWIWIMKICKTMVHLHSFLWVPENFLFLSGRPLGSNLQILASVCQLRQLSNLTFAKRMLHFIYLSDKLSMIAYVVWWGRIIDPLWMIQTGRQAESNERVEEFYPL